MNTFSSQFVNASKASAAVDYQALIFEGSLIALFSILGVFALAAMGCDAQFLTGSSWALW